MLNKLRRRIKNWWICGDEFEDVIAEVVRKKITDEKKFDLLCKLTSFYMKNHMKDAAKFAAWENYYERIMVNGQENKEVAENFLKYEYGNFLYHTIYKLSREVGKLDVQKPNKLCKMLEDFQIAVLDFQPADFYVQCSLYRTQQLTKADVIAKALDNYCKQHTTTSTVAIQENNYCAQ